MNEEEFKKIAPVLEDAMDFATERAEQILKQSGQLHSYLSLYNTEIDGDFICLTYEEFAMGHCVGGEGFSISLDDLSRPVGEVVQEIQDARERELHTQERQALFRKKQDQQKQQQQRRATYERLKQEFEN